MNNTTRFSIWMIAATLAASSSLSAQTWWYVDVGTCSGMGDGSIADPFCQIQQCIDASTNGDTCHVGPGTYHEVVDFEGKAIRLIATDGPRTTIIDGTGLGNSVVICHSGEGPQTQLVGFTIAHGTGSTTIEPGSEVGGGMSILNSSPTIMNCIFRDNSAGGNFGGGGLFIRNGGPLIIGSAFLNNTSDNNGGGIYSNMSSPEIQNCTITGNVAVDRGGGIIHNQVGVIVVTNSILWGNSDSGGSDESAQIHTDLGGTATLSYSAIQGLFNFVGDGNIGADPKFLGASVNLSSTSPCIDAGDTTALPIGFYVDLSGNGRVLDDPLTTDTGVPGPLLPVTVDIGAVEYSLIGDLNRDLHVDLLDYSIFAVGITGP